MPATILFVSAGEVTHRASFSVQELVQLIQVGFVPAQVVAQLQKYPQVFTVRKVDVTINEDLKSAEERNKAKPPLARTKH